MKISPGTGALLISSMAAAAVLYITLYSDSGVQISKDEATYEVETYRLSGDDTKMGKENTQATSLMAPRCRKVPDQPEQPERRPEEQQSRILTDISKKMHSAV